MKSSRLAALAALPLLLTAFTACGDDTDQKSDNSDTQQTESAVDAEASDSPAPDDSAPAAPAGAISPTTFADQIRSDSADVTSFHVETESEGEFALAGSVSGDFDYTQDPPSFHVTTTMGEAEPLQIIAVGKKEYTKMGGAWVRSRRTEEGSVDPFQQLYDALAEAEFVTRVGSQEHEGASVETYEVTISLAVPDSEVDVDLPDQIVMEVWLDQEGRLVRMSSGSDHPGFEGSSVTTISAYDEPVTIEAPADDDII